MQCLLPCYIRDAPLLQASFTLWTRGAQTVPDFWHQTLWKVGPRPRGTKQFFNRAHLSLRSVIEQSFGMLKIKWRILLGLPHYSERKLTKIILACCGLHNFIWRMIVMIYTTIWMRKRRNGQWMRQIRMMPMRQVMTRHGCRHE